MAYLQKTPKAAPLVSDLLNRYNVLTHWQREILLDKEKMYRKSALASYSDIDVETKTESQSPAQLVLMLFDKACVLLRQASENLAHEEVEAFDKATTHAMQIVIALRGVLDMEQGGEVAQSLYETYTSIAASLFKAKNEKDGDSIVKLYTAMSELREAWQTVS